MQDISRFPFDKCLFPAIFEKKSIEDMDENGTKGKQRVSMYFPKKLLEQIDDQAKLAGINRTKYIIQMILGIRPEMDTRNQLDAIRHIMENPSNWDRLPAKFQTKEIFCAIASLDQKSAAAIMNRIPCDWWNCLSKDVIVDQAAKECHILHELPPKYRRAALSCIRKTAKAYWIEKDKNKVTSPKGKRDRKPPRSKKTSPQKTGLPSGPDLFDGLQ